MEELFWMRKEVRMKQKAYPAPDRKNCKDNCVGVSLLGLWGGGGFFCVFLRGF
jgi:hypothetical protein